MYDSPTDLKEKVPNNANPINPIKIEIDNAGANNFL